jgi:hypothetical protein
MQLQIKEHFEAALAEEVNEGISRSIVEFQPYFEPLTGAFQLVDQRQRFGTGREVQRNH